MSYRAFWQRRCPVSYTHLRAHETRHDLIQKADLAVLAVIHIVDANLVAAARQVDPAGGGKQAGKVFHADADETTLHLTIQDDGTGYPQSVLAVLNGEPEGENAPHILGLHVVEQIINAHGGSVQFVNRDPHGAKVMMQLPLAKDENEK